MSHYIVAVFTKDIDQDIDEMMAPYDESISVAPYVACTKAQLIQREREQMQMIFESRYMEWKNDSTTYEENCKIPGHIEYLRQLPQQMRRSDEDLYAQIICDYEKEEISKCGGILSTYNPSSKWDRYVVGGRWQGQLILKERADGKRGVPAHGMKSSENYDIARVRDIDFKAMECKARENLRPYEKAITDSIYREEYQRQRFPTEEEYVKRCVIFHTYAVVTPDSCWHAPGNMGWFGVQNASADDERDWDINYHETFIKPALENDWYLTILDCHI